MLKKIFSILIIISVLAVGYSISSVSAETGDVIQIINKTGGYGNGFEASGINNISTQSTNVEAFQSQWGTVIQAGPGSGVTQGARFVSTAGANVKNARQYNYTGGRSINTGLDWATNVKLEGWFGLIAPAERLGDITDFRVGVALKGSDGRTISLTVPIEDFLDISSSSVRQWQYFSIPLSYLKANGLGQDWAATEGANYTWTNDTWQNLNSAIFFMTTNYTADRIQTAYLADLKFVEYDGTLPKASVPMLSQNDTTIRPYEKFEIIFDKDMDKDTLLASNFIFDNGTSVSGVIINDNGKSCVLNFSEPLDFGKTYNLSLSGIKCANGNDIDSTTASFSFNTSEQPEAYITGISAGSAPNVNISFNTNGDIFAVLYNNAGDVNEIKYAKQASSINASFLNEEEDCRIDVFMWDSFAGMRLKSPVYRIINGTVFVPQYGLNPTAVSINNFNARNNTTTFMVDIAGKLNTADKSAVTAIVARADYNLSEAASGIIDLADVAYIENILTDEEGSFAKAVKLENSDSYTAYAGTEKSGFSVEKAFTYVDPALILDLLSGEKLSSPELTAAEAKMYIENTLLGLDLTDYNQSCMDKNKAAALFVKYKPSEFESVAEVQLLLDKVVGMVLLDKETLLSNMDKWIVKYGENSGILPEILTGYTDCTAQSVKSQIATLAMALDLSDETKINEKFAGICAVAYVNSPSNTWGIVKNILTVDYEDYVNIDTSAITNAGVSEADVYKAMLNQNYQSRQAMENDFTVIINKLKNSKTTYSSSSGGSPSGGSTRIITAPPVELADLPEVTGGDNEESGFKDLGTVMWAYDAINTLADLDIISRAEEFRPNDSITRAEFTKLVVMGFNLFDPAAICDFNDISANDWWYSYIASAKNEGVIDGISETAFLPNEKISRQDMAVIIYRALKLEAGLTEDYVNEFADQGDISDYALKAVLLMKENGIIEGMGDNLFAPNNFATRAEASVIIYKSIKIAE